MVIVVGSYTTTGSSMRPSGLDPLLHSISLMSKSTLFACAVTG
jgi:hypothetical protein